MLMANYLEILLKEEWDLIVNNKSHLIYVRKVDTNEEYIEVVKKSEHLIEVSIPLMKSCIQYRTSFNTEMQAYEYLEDHYYEEYINMKKQKLVEPIWKS